MEQNPPTTEFTREALWGRASWKKSDANLNKSAACDAGEQGIEQECERGGEEIGFLSGDSDALQIARSRSYWRQGVSYKDVSQLLAVKSARANPFQLAPVSPSR